MLCKACAGKGCVDCENLGSLSRHELLAIKMWRDSPNSVRIGGVAGGLAGALGTALGVSKMRKKYFGNQEY